MISEFPLFVFTTSVGLAAGVYMVSVLCPVNKTDDRPWLIPIVCLALLLIGLVGLPLHLGHPERLFDALANPKAMIAQEAYWSAAFGLLGIIDFVLVKMKGHSVRSVRIVCAVIALVLTLVMANAYFVSKGVAEWSSWQTFPLYLIGNIAMGASFYLVLNEGLLKDGKYAVMAIGILTLSILSFALEAMHFMSVGSAPSPFVLSSIVMLVAIVLIAVSRRFDANSKAFSWGIFACVFISVAVARYGFYAACTL